MKLIDREMLVKDFITDKSNTLCYCQASFNSDGYITLRNYDIQNKDSDEIIILSAEETQAIIKLLNRLFQIKQDINVPF